MSRKLQNSSNLKTVIEVKDLCKTFYLKDDIKPSLRSLFTSFFNQGKTKRFKALENISFELKRGDFLGVIGKNGSGKSTLLKILAKIYSPDKGSFINIRGKIIPFLELGVGFNAELTGRENIFLNGTILGLGKDYLLKNFDRIVEFAGLKEFINMPVKNYSSGMIVRLAFSIALQADGDIYILDEILAVGDADFQAKSLSVINQLIKQGKTMLFVSHDINSIENFCNKVLVINNHKAQLFDNTREGIDYYKRILYSNNQLDSTVQSDISDNRVGTREVYFTKYFFEGALANNTTIFNSNDKIRIHLQYKNYMNIKKAILGIAIFNDRGVLISGTNTKVMQIEFDLNQETGSFIYELDAKLLLDGKYSLTIALFEYDTERPYDYFSDALRFEIRIGIKNVGLVSLPVSISHQS